MTTGHCRFCSAPLHRSFVDLGRSPLANSFLSQDDLHRMEPFYPLQAFVCDSCCLVQLEEFQNAQAIFGDYLYFSSYSEGWLRHSEAYAARMIERLRLDENSRVVEVASNDGYLLQFFQQRGIRVLGVEPAANIAKVASAKGIPSETAFFGVETARRLSARGHHADLMTANNVLAHVPDLNDFVAGFPILLKRHGVATFEFPHLLRLIQQRQFDTIYHEHFSYLSLLVVDRVFGHHGMAAYDVELLPTHGGSLRVYATHSETAPPKSDRFQSVIAAEKWAGLDQPASYADFGQVVADVKCQLLTFLIDARRQGKTVAGYGAPAKGNTLLNYCGIGPELMPFTVDRSPHKQGRYLPGVQIPIAQPDLIFQTKPEFLLILPWNLKEEIIGQMERVRDWGGRFVTAIPNLEIF